jgi:transcriptional regulator with XRE-family HTH domain
MMSIKTSYRERDYTYGQAIFTLRTTIGLTQEQLGNRLGISPCSIREWETGSSYPKTERLKALIALAVQSQAFTTGREA